MPSNKVEIANIALVGLRATTINSFEDETTEASVIKVLWDNIRQSELSKHPYNFAIKRSKLARLSNEPLFGYQYQYQLPVDCLRVIKVEDNVDYKLEKDGRILTNAESVELKYVYDNEDVSTWSASFSALMAAKLRVELSFPLAADKEMTKLSIELYERKLRDARWIDASGDIPDKFGQQQTNIIGVRY